MTTIAAGEAGQPSAAQRELIALRMAGLAPSRAVREIASREDARAPLSPAQQGLWVVANLHPGTPAYHLPVAMRLDGVLNVETLAWSLGEVIRRHEVLRSRFFEEDGVPVQEVLPATTAPLTVVDLVDLAAGGRPEAALRLLGEEGVRPFDLGSGRPLRALLVRLASERHALLLVAHHLVADGWSMETLLAELSELYTSSIQGREPALPQLDVQYGDYAAWQRRRAASGELADDLAYWRRTLDGAPQVLELPADRPRPAVPTLAGGARRLQLSPELTRELRDLGRAEGATLFGTLLAGFSVLLWRCTGEAELLVATPHANRDRPELLDLVGLFVNVLVMRCDLRGAPTFRELVRRVRGVVVEALTHSELPFERLVEELRPARDTSRNPLVQVSFKFDATDPGVLELPGVSGERIDVGRDGAQFDLNVGVTAWGGGLDVLAEYSTDLFDAERVDRMLRHLEELLRGAVAEPDRPIGRLPLLTRPDHLEQDGWNRTAAEHGGAGTLQALFEVQAARAPDRMAVVSEGEQLSYGELNRRANRLASVLRERGVGADTRVGLCLERSPEMVVALLAVLKAGGAYVPLDPEHPAERLAYVVRDAGVSVAIAEEHTRGILPAMGLDVLCVDGEAWAAAGPQENPRSGAGPESLAYVMYTSGSTGRPKGVMVRQAGICNRVQWMTAALGLGHGDVVLQKTAFGFDASVWEFFLPLTTGGRLVLARPGGHRDGEYLVDLVERAGVTVLQLVPSMLDVVLVEGAAARLRGLRWLFCGGEALSARMVERCRAELGWVRLHNTYGPTEATIDAASYACERWSGGPVPIGVPLSNVRVEVLDAELQRAPAGVPGELCIGGTGLARGYQGQPGLTAERFVPDGFGGPGGRLYRTGDRGCWRRDGTLLFLGRRDHQVKIRGTRIELGEIEAVLLRHPAVRECCVLARGAETGGPGRLVAYVVLDRHVQAPAAEELIAHLAGELPSAMVPASSVVLEAMPLMHNGKLDRGALPAPDAGVARSSPSYAEPRTEVERALAPIWAEVLGLAEVGTRDDFFALGGHSLSALVLVARARSAFQVDVRLRDVFASPTVERFAVLVDTLSLALTGSQVDEGEIL